MVRRMPVFALLLSLCLAPCMLGAQPAIQPAVDITKVPAAAQPSDHFDADAATEAYMAMMPPAAIARSNAYFEGGYWLILWDFLLSSAISLLLLQTRWSARMRELAERITRFRWLQNAIYWIQYLVITSIFGFPLAWYEGLYREQKYGLATQTIGLWTGDQFKAFLISAILGAIVVIILMAVVRVAPRTWWIWGSLVGIVLTVVLVAIAPVYPPASLQQNHSPRRPPRDRAHLAHGPRQRHSRQRCL